MAPEMPGMRIFTSDLRGVQTSSALDQIRDRAFHLFDVAENDFVLFAARALKNQWRSVKNFELHRQRQRHQIRRDRHVRNAEQFFRATRALEIVGMASPPPKKPNGMIGVRVFKARRMKPVPKSTSE